VRLKRGASHALSPASDGVGCSLDGMVLIPGYVSRRADGRGLVQMLRHALVAGITAGAVDRVSGCNVFAIPEGVGARAINMNLLSICGSASERAALTRVSEVATPSSRIGGSEKTLQEQMRSS
jgi:hypothetical protein